MTMKAKAERQTVLGGVLVLAGVFLYSDTIGIAKVYGYTANSVIEFAIGTAATVAGAILLFLAGMNRKRTALAATRRRGSRADGMMAPRRTRRYTVSSSPPRHRSRTSLRRRSRPSRA